MLTRRMPSTPENGARIVFRSIAALISPTLAFAWRSSAVALSNSARETTRSSSRPWMRSKFTRARSRCASAAASCARSCRVSWTARTSPSRTASPDSNAIRSTTPGRSALTVTPRTAATVPMAVSVDGHSSRAATIVVTASGGGWYAAPCAIMVWICLTFTKPRAATIPSVTASITIIRFHMSSSPHGVDHDAAVKAMPVSRDLSEETRRVVIRSHGDEPVVAPQTPAPVAEPLDATAHVARQEGVGLRNAEGCLVEERQAADATDRVRRDRGVIGRVHDHVAGVIEQVRRLLIRRHAGELQVLGDAEVAADFALDADPAIEVELDSPAETVVAEAGSLRVAAFGEERRAARNDRDGHLARSRRARLLRVHLTRSCESHDGERRRDHRCNLPFHD